MEDGNVDQTKYREGLERHAQDTLQFLRTQSREDIDQRSDNILHHIRECLQKNTALAEAISSVMLLRDYMWQRGLWGQWDQYVALAIEKAATRDENATVATLLTYRAGLHEALANWNLTVGLAEEALSGKCDPETESEALFHLGTAKHNLGDYRTAEQVLRRALTITYDSSRRMRIQHKLARTLSALGDTQAAIFLLEAVKEWTQKKHFEWFEAEVILDEAGLMKAHDNEGATTLARQSLDIYTGLGFLRGIAYAYLELGRIWIQKKDAPDALRALKHAESIFQDTDYSPGLAHVAFALGQIQLQNEGYREAGKTFAKSFTFAQRTNYAAGMIRSRIYQCLADWKAHRYFAFFKGFVRIVQFLCCINAPVSLKVHRVMQLWRGE